MRHDLLKTFAFAVWMTLLLSPVVSSRAQDMPHNQDRPPNPPRSPEEAVDKMTVPDGFQVEIVAAEPEIVNPVAMTFDDRGRVWITESLEYPRRDAGKGRDRIKILEDTDGDGRADKFTVFADGLNIPSGIALGYGGVWVANSPDLLFMRDTDGDDRADRVKVVVTGFGRSDVHELPNSLTWGPDGWLYGLNGVFNPCHIKHRDQEHRFTCALFRINPRADEDGPFRGTHDFQLFAEGTSNPWGVAFDTEGSAFISACVIDHLWHLTETGYYHRQGGAYPPFTWKLGSIVDYRHQKAAYCGITYFDSDAYPLEYREKLYMGNIHGGCINVDSLRRDGASYRGQGEPDFFSAHDAWFMPIVQKVGPDGCLYVLDWYDRYHCYQDARRDPEGVDRQKGRLYRVRYKNSPRAPKFDLAAESDDRLIERLHSPNVYFRDVAQRLLTERASVALADKLQRLVLDDRAPRKARMHALWAIVGGRALQPRFHEKLLDHEDASFRAWGVRAAGNMGDVTDRVGRKIVALTADPAPDVQLQVAIAAAKLDAVDTVATLVGVLNHCGDDKLIPQIVWQNLHPRLEAEGGALADVVAGGDLSSMPNLVSLMPRIVERTLAVAEPDLENFAKLFGLLAAGGEAGRAAAAECLRLFAGRIQSGEVTTGQLATLRPKLEPHLRLILEAGSSDPLYLDTVLVAALWNDSAAIEVVRRIALSADHPPLDRTRALDALIGVDDEQVVRIAETMLASRGGNSGGLAPAVLGSLGRSGRAEIARVVLAAYDGLDSQTRPKAIELLTQRPAWSRELLAAVDEKKIPTDVVNVNQIRSLLASPEPSIVRSARAIWGTVRTERNPGRERVIFMMKRDFLAHRGDPLKGRQAYNKVCAQCHKMYGEGEDIGPDLTSNGRASFDQLLSNVFDPSLVIGPAYQARIVITDAGRVLTGLLTEESETRIVLKVQGGESEIIPREEIDELVESKLSMMPEKLEDQLTIDELRDLFALLTLDKPPTEPDARPIPGAGRLHDRSMRGATSSGEPAGR